MKRPFAIVALAAALAIGVPQSARADHGAILLAGFDRVVSIDEITQTLHFDRVVSSPRVQYSAGGRTGIVSDGHIFLELDARGHILGQIDYHTQTLAVRSDGVAVGSVDRGGTTFTRIFAPYSSHGSVDRADPTFVEAAFNDDGNLDVRLQDGVAVRNGKLRDLFFIPIRGIVKMARSGEDVYVITSSRLLWYRTTRLMQELPLNADLANLAIPTTNQVVVAASGCVTGKTSLMRVRFEPRPRIVWTRVMPRGNVPSIATSEDYAFVALLGCGTERSIKQVREYDDTGDYRARLNVPNSYPVRQIYFER